MRAYASTLILMVVTVASFKGGVGKSTTAIHLAAYLQALAPALLVDGDPNRSVSEWARAGKLPFKVVDERQAALHAKEFEHIVIDTKARPDEEDLRAWSGACGCHLLVIPWHSRSVKFACFGFDRNSPEEYRSRPVSRFTHRGAAASEPRWRRCEGND